MARIHSNLDIFVGDDLLYTDTRVVEDMSQRFITVKARQSNGIGWVNVLTVRDFTVETVGSNDGYTWRGTSEGEAIVVTGLRRAPRCCGR